MEASTIQKYSKLSTSTLKLRAIKTFNAWIRDRDKSEFDGYFVCGMCNKSKKITYSRTGGSNYHACHYINAGHHDYLRFTKTNVVGGCNSCNTHKGGNLIAYRKNLVRRFGEIEVQKNELLIDYWKANNWTGWSRLDLIDIIEKHKLKPRKQFIL